MSLNIKDTFKKLDFVSLKTRAITLVLRLFSLFGKFVLVLYMGRYFDLSAIGVYGLVFAAVALVSAILGQELGYIVRREIVNISRVDGLQKMRDQLIFHGLHYCILASIVAIMIFLGGFDIPIKYYVYVLALSIIENMGTMTYNNMILLGLPVWANLALSIRSSAWVILVVFLGWNDVFFRTADVVLMCWTGGSLLSLSVPLWVWRNWGWQQVQRRAINWVWVFRSVQKSSLIWFATVGSMTGAYIDRYIVNHFLNLDYVGVVTFYSSFTNVMLTLVESGVLAFSAPKLVRMHKENDIEGFRREMKRSCWETAISAGVFALFLAFFVPFIGIYMEKPLIVSEKGTLWLLLVAAWIQAMSACLYSMLYAQHRDQQIWISNAISAVAAVFFSFTFVRLFGLIGVGYAAVAKALFVFWWLLASAALSPLLLRICARNKWPN